MLHFMACEFRHEFMYSLATWSLTLSFRVHSVAWLGNHVMVAAPVPLWHLSTNHHDGYTVASGWGSPGWRCQPSRWWVFKLPYQRRFNLRSRTRRPTVSWLGKPGSGIMTQWCTADRPVRRGLRRPTSVNPLGRWHARRRSGRRPKLDLKQHRSEPRRLPARDTDSETGLGCPHW